MERNKTYFFDHSPNKTTEAFLVSLQHLLLSRLIRNIRFKLLLTIERTELVFQPVFKTGKGRIKPALAGSIPALSAQIKGRHGRL